jgi:hypothetical protein
MPCPAFLWFFVQVKLGQNLPCPVVMARQGRQGQNLLSPATFYLCVVMTRQGRKICSALQLWLCVAMAR